MPGKRESEHSGHVFPPPPLTFTPLPTSMRVRIGTQRALGVDTTMVAAHAAAMGVADSSRNMRGGEVPW